MPTSKAYRVFSGLCPDEKCQAKLFFPSYDTSIECTACGQRHEQQALRNLEEVTNPCVALQNMLRHLLVGTTVPKKGAEMVKVLGLSNYHCKLLSPLLTYFGMDRKTGKACLLRDLNQGEIFDCALLGDRAFVIDPEHIETIGYGRDISGSATYLSDTQKMINAYNDGEDNLVPIHADGDGHCLVHAISRALVGRELFWHPLRINLKYHFQKYLPNYKELFRDFIDTSEWQDIIDECDPDFQPPDGELLGLRNIHVFGLANVLRRPIILLDSLSGMQSSGDYSALFLPGLINPQDCRGKSGELNKPLCIAWSSPGRNHYIPLVGIKRAPLPKLPQCLIPKPWGVSETLVQQYLEFDPNGVCIIGGDKCLQDSYVLRLAAAMEDVFMKKYNVHPAIVADVHHYIYKRTGVVGAHLKEVLQATQRVVQEGRLYRCFTCDAVCEVTGSFGGLATSDLEQEEILDSRKTLDKCTWCHGSTMRLINADGSIRYHNGDRTKTKAKSTTCTCGFKHYWDGKEYDNLPVIIPVILEWGNKRISEKVPWFQSESDVTLNSNVYDVANSLLQKHFPGVFGSERLLQKVVDQILEQTKKPEEIETSESMQTSARESSPSKIIITGYKTLHKEELTMSDTERSVKQRIESKAALVQHKSLEKSRATSGLSPKKMSPVMTERKNLSQIQHSEESKARHGSPEKISATANMIRVVTSDGKQLRLPLNTVGTFSSFSEMLESKLGIPSSHQRILYGFPPKELHPPAPSDENNPLPFQHGDKVTVEILPQFNTKQETPPHVSSDVRQPPQSSYGGFDTEPFRERFWQKLQQDMQNSNVQNINAVMTSLMLSATLSNKSLWSYVQTKPELFLPGGIFYLEVERDIGLVDGKHCSLPFLPDKVFQYNAEQDRLELCVHPYGHFGIEPGIDEHVAALSLSKLKQEGSSGQISSVGSSSFSTTSTTSTSLAGSSGVVLSKSKELLANHTPFQGQGYILSRSMQEQSLNMGDVDDEKMDGLEASKDDSFVEASISSSANILPLTRKAPGVSVINPEAAIYPNKNVERLKVLAQTIKEIASEYNEKRTASKIDSTDVQASDVTMSEVLLPSPTMDNAPHDFHSGFDTCVSITPLDSTIESNPHPSETETNLESLESTSSRVIEMVNVDNESQSGEN